MYLCGTKPKKIQVYLLSMDTNVKVPHVVIEPKKGWQIINFKELREYRDLFKLMVLRDVTVQYKQTILGFAWAIINPLFTMLVFSVIFGKRGLGPDHVPYKLFSLAALVPWTYFNQALVNSTNSLITQSSILTKVYFPRLIIPLTPIFAKLTDFAIAMGIMIIFMIFYHNELTLNSNLAYFPMLLLLMMITAAGMGMWLSSLAIQYRDIKFAITFMIQIMMYAAPIIWTTEKIGHQYRILYGLYPLAGIIEGFRACLIGNPVQMPWDMIIPGAIVSVIIFISGAMYFRRMEKVFADVA
jgi:lipopolysaccharide transport system permease protein